MMYKLSLLGTKIKVIPNAFTFYMHYNIKKNDYKSKQYVNKLNGYKYEYVNLHSSEIDINR